MVNKTFENVGGLHPGKTVFDLSYEKKFDGDMGYLYPVLLEEAVPGDTWKIGNQLLVKYQPMLASLIHEMNARVHYFFVPTRLLMTEDEVPVGSSIPVEHLWDKFITGGDIVDNETLALEGDSIELPRWQPPTSAGYGVHSLWDYCGYPIGVQPDKYNCPLSFGKRAINFIWNEYYRNEAFMDEVDLDNDEMLKVCWEKDYFTSALPWQQKGIAPALPVNVSVESELSGYAPVHKTANPVLTFDFVQAGEQNVQVDNSGHLFFGATPGNFDQIKDLKANADLSSGSISSTANAYTFDVSDLRVTVQIQKFLERNARAGSRYTSWLRAHYGVSPSDSRLDRPEYLGGSKSPVIISEVLQTSSTDAVTPQGNMAGHGLVADSNFITSYHVEEFGYIVGLLNIAPKANYSQGINKQWLRKTKWDFYLPEFSRLSEEAIKTSEIYTTDDEDQNNTIFGYQGRYNEMRAKQSMICGSLRTDLNYWHLGREFDEAPILNASFLECNPRKDIFAVPSEPGLIIDFANICKVARPMPLIPEPGLVDHF